MKRPVPRLALRVDEAAASLGMSVDSFQRHVAGELRTVYVGRVKVYAVAELERYLERQAVAAPVSLTGVVSETAWRGAPHRCGAHAGQPGAAADGRRRHVFGVRRAAP